LGKGDVSARRLAMPFPERVSARAWAYWLAYPKERRMVPKVKRFREWLLAEMERAIREADGGWGHAEDADSTAEVEVST
jgi:LysR family glycine cleavage system transcriptional activator